MLHTKLLLILLGIFSLSYTHASPPHSPLYIGPNNPIDVNDFKSVVYQKKSVALSNDCKERLIETRRFVDHLLNHNITVYGLTTGFADLRNYAVSPEKAAELSHNIIQSHDAGIGKTLPKEVIRGAMFLRANSLAQGHSAIRIETIELLLHMLNKDIIPLIPETGSLGASGDLAFLARLGRSMEGDPVDVWYKDQITSATDALQRESLTPPSPAAKEGLAITNGTAFMASMLTIGLLDEIKIYENILASEGLFLNAVLAIDAAFSDSIQAVRMQSGQQIIASILRKHLQHSPFINRQGTQNDYCIRCLPQVLGFSYEALQHIKSITERELNAVTDNPLLFKNEEIAPDIQLGRLFDFENNTWAVLSGGNFHGEYLAAAADSLARINAKIALTLERQITYMLNPFRNGNATLPPYLIYNKNDVGLQSGFMIVQYTANALAQKIAYLGNPVSIYNITSANESEDIVSYGATATQKLLDQQAYLKQLVTLFVTTSLQAYAIQREQYTSNNVHVPEELIAEAIFNAINPLNTPFSFPIKQDIPFDKIYEIIESSLIERPLGKFLNYPLSLALNINTLNNE